MNDPMIIAVLAATAYGLGSMIASFLLGVFTDPDKVNDAEYLAYVFLWPWYAAYAGGQLVRWAYEEIF